MIEINQVSFTYNKAVNDAAIREINIQILKGQTILLCGESGSGKTTFGRLINGLIPAYYEGNLNGSVIVAGKNVEKLELHELASYVGSVFQNPKSQFYTLLTDTEIVFACENMGMEKNTIAARFETTVKSLHIEQLLGKNLFILSGGEKQKIACASVHALMPDIFVLDEPTSNLDVGTIQDLRKILKEWKAQGKTVVISEHRIAWLHDIADRVLFFKDGKIERDFDAKSFWEMNQDEFHSMGLRAAVRFLPKAKAISNISEKITLQNFHFSDGATELLSIEQLDIPKGAVVAVLGNNGAGKTTFARCLCGLEKKAKGTLIYGGYTYNRKQRIRICYMVMQDVNHQLFTESVADEILLGIKDLDTDAKKQTVDKILTELDLVDYKESHPMSLSGGQKQRVAIAGAVSSKKELIIFDEPTSGLDYRHMREVAKSVNQLSEMGKTQFIITHDPELVSSCCNYFIFMEKGKVVHSGGWTVENSKSISDYFGMI